MLTRTTSEERRRLPLSTARVTIRAEGDDERFFGHAAVFNERTSIGNPLRWGFYEEIAPGAFTKTLSEGDQRFLLDHDSFYVVSRVSAGTLHLAQDAKGLPVNSALDPELSYVRDLKANVRNGNITGMSFGFYVPEGKDDWQTVSVETVEGDTVEAELRIIREVRLIEVSAVTFPAYEGTDAELHSVATALVHRGDEDAIERRAAYRPELRDLTGLSRRSVHAVPGLRKAIASHSTDTSTGSWDGPAATKNLPAEKGPLRAAHAWVDADGDADTKSSYKFPHHFVDSDGKVGAASTAACTAGIAVLNGGRGGANIPDEDRKGVHAHLAKHLKDAGMEPAELKSQDIDREPAETTRGTDAESEPAVSTRLKRDAIDLRMRGLAARFRLPRD